METAYYVMIGVIMLAMYAGMAYDGYSKRQCVVSYAQSNKTVEDIAKLCK